MSRLEVWAPRAERVALWIAPQGSRPDRSLATAMRRCADGIFAAEVAEEAMGSDYGFFLDDDDRLYPDPRSRRQPYGVNGPSRLWRDEQPWNDDAWGGRLLPRSVFYELHVGTFTPEGTLDAAIGKLDHLVDLGITHVELLPLNDFDGEWNWGYDGVLWYAVHEAYGGPDALHRFVDACHCAGLAVTLDVVYNHLGLAGNYLPRFGPYLKEGHNNTWGQLVNLDGEQSGPVREYILDNALMWLSEFHIDALRLDAIHALSDTSPVHLLAELAERVEDLQAETGRAIVLVAESELNDVRVVAAVKEAGLGMDAQWDDDIHHALHALLTGERQGYYVDFGSLSTLAATWKGAFFHDGRYSRFRRRPHGLPVPRGLLASRFVGFLQNHDQIGNRAGGERLDELAPPQAVELGAVILLTSPFTPLLFMGEEWGASTRWPYFTSHEDPEIAAAVGPGRIAEFEGYGWDLSTMIDPQDPRAFEEAKLRWDELEESSHRERLRLYRRLLALRVQIPELTEAPVGTLDIEVDEEKRTIRIGRADILLLLNFGEEPWPVAETAGAILFANGHLELAGGGITLSPFAAVVLRLSGD